MITLTSAEQFTVGGVVQETNSIAGVISDSTDYLANTMTITVASGALNSNNVKPSPRSTLTTFIINLTTGVVTVNGGTVATLGAGALATLNTSVRNKRNQIETALTGLSLVLGNQTAWT